MSDGIARVGEVAVPVDRNEEYLAKYGETITGRLRMPPEHFAQAYPVPIRIGKLRVRGH